MRAIASIPFPLLESSDRTTDSAPSPTQSPLRPPQPEESAFQQGSKSGGVISPSEMSDEGIQHTLSLNGSSDSVSNAGYPRAPSIVVMNTDATSAVPSGILKRVAAVGMKQGSTSTPTNSSFVKRVPSDMANSFALNAASCPTAPTAPNQSCRRTGSNLASGANLDDSDEIQFQRVSSSVRFQLPEAKRLSAKQDAETTDCEEKTGGLTGFWRMLTGKPQESQLEEPDAAPASDPHEIAKLKHPSITEDSACVDRSRVADALGESYSESAKRFDVSGSPMGSFYFAGNSQVYIPDAPEDIMDIPSNQSFAGGGSFCSSPVVISKRLKTVDVSHNLQVLNDQYVIYMDKLIGSGSFGEVHLCYSIAEEVYYAVKVLDRKRLERMGIGTGNNAMEKLLNEIAIMQRLRHDNIIALKEVINDSYANTVYLILELAGYGPLLKLENGFVEPDCEGNTRINENTVQELVHSMVQALVYAHREGVAHRDIKPDNVLLTGDSQVKVSDFGVSCLVDKQRALDREGSIAFLPPEMLLPITKEKFIAPSPHVSAMCANGEDGDEDPLCVFGRLAQDSMVPLSMDNCADSFSAQSSGDYLGRKRRTSSDHMLSTPDTRPASGKGKKESTSSYSISVPNRRVSSHTEVDSDELKPMPELMSPSQLGGRARIKQEEPREFVKSPNNSSFTRTPKVGWRHVNRNEIDLFKADVWALGVTTFVMLHGRLPWLAHLEMISNKADISLDEENAITEYLDPQSRFRLSLYQRWKRRQFTDDRLDAGTDHSYLSPYRLGNASFTKPPDAIGCSSTEADSPTCNGDKADKQNIEYAFWKYWSSLVQDSHLGEHHPHAATEKQLKAILCHPDPVALFHTTSDSKRKGGNFSKVPKTHSWEVFASSDEDADERALDFCETHVCSRREEESTASPRRPRSRSFKVVEDLDKYLVRHSSVCGDPHGKCDTCSPQAINFIRECLQIDPVVRPTMEDLLHHPWLAASRQTYEQKQRDTTAQATFGDIPVVTESATHMTRPIQPADVERPTETSARPIAKEEIRQLPETLPFLFNNATNTAGLLKATTGHVAFSNILTQQRRAIDDSALLDLRHRGRERQGVDSNQLSGTGSESVSSEKCASPLRRLLGETKGSMPSRSLSLPTRLDELGDRLFDELCALEKENPAPRPIGRRRNLTLVPVTSQAEEMIGQQSSPLAKNPKNN